MKLQAIIREASRDLLGGFELRADCKPNAIVRYPDRFVDKRELEDGIEALESVDGTHREGRSGWTICQSPKLRQWSCSRREKKKGRGHSRRFATRHLGAPFEFLVEVCRSTEGRAALIVALLIYRRTVVCHSPTITLSAAELTELDVSREMKRRSLVQLATAGLIRIGRTPPGCAAAATLLWKAGNRLL